MIKNQDLNQIKKYVVDILPQLLREEPSILTTIEGIIAQHFPQREEFVRLVEEIKLFHEIVERRFEQVEKHIDQQLQRTDLLHQEMNRRFEQVDKRFEQVEKRLDQQQQRIDLLHQEMNRRFEQVDKRFEQIEKRLDQQQQQIDLLHQEMNRRFEQVDKRFEQVDKRFEQVEKRLDQQQQQIDLLHQEMNRRFEQVDKRFEQVDKRFEQVDKRFEQVEKRLEQIDTRLDQQQQQIDLLRKDVLDLNLDMKRQMTQMRSDIGQMNRKITQFDGWLKLISGTKGDEKGQSLEQAFALGLSYGLKDRDIKPETIQLRQTFVDSEGVVFFKKRKWIEVDLVAENDKLTVFEVKTSSKETDVELFAKKMKVVQLAHPEKQVPGIFISPGASEEVEQHCQEWGIQFLG